MQQTQDPTKPRNIFFKMTMMPMMMIVMMTTMLRWRIDEDLMRRMQTGSGPDPGESLDDLWIKILQLSDAGLSSSTRVHSDHLWLW